MPEITEVDIKVCVKDTDDNPINNADVVLSKGTTEYTGTTGTAGGCTLRNVVLDTYSLTVSCTGYVTETDNITVTEDTTTLNIVLITE